MRRHLVLIAGAGIGGLTAAIARHAIGIRAEAYEAARPIRPGSYIPLKLPTTSSVLILLGATPINNKYTIIHTVEQDSKRQR